MATMTWMRTKLVPLESSGTVTGVGRGRRLLTMAALYGPLAQAGGESVGDLSSVPSVRHGLVLKAVLRPDSSRCTEGPFAQESQL